MPDIVAPNGPVDAPTPAQHTKAMRLADSCYRLAYQGEWDKASQVLQRISDECGPTAIALALRTWINTYIDHATNGHPPSETVHALFVNADTLQTDTADSDRLWPELRWAGQMVFAQAAIDQKRWLELIAELPDDPAAVGVHVFAVLQIVAMTTRHVPRGFSLR